MSIAGMGFRAGAGEASLADALAKAAGSCDPEAIAVLADKADRPVLRALAGRLGLPVIAIARETLAGVETQTHSARVAAMLGTGSAAEALALAALAPGARLVRARVLSDDRMASAAIAEGELAGGPLA